MKDRQGIFGLIYRLKLVLFGVGLLLLSLALAALGEWLDSEDVSHLLVAVTNGVSDALLVAGAIGIAADFFVGGAKDVADAERTKRLLDESVPAFTDAVIKGFAAAPDDLSRVATPELLDDLATNALALRLGDPRFAAEIYDSLLEQAVRSPERWEDLNIDIRLSSVGEGSGAASTQSPTGVPLFEVTITWDYEVVPSAQIRKFACVSDRGEFRELLSEVPATSTWFLSPRTGLAPSDAAAYELLTFTVDGEERPIRRNVSKSRQTYSVDLGEDVVRAGKSVRIRHTLRAVVTREGHWLQVAMPQPTKDLSLALDYTNTDIATLQVTDLVSSAKQPWVAFLPQQQPSRVVSLDVPGWLLPQAQVTFIWTLEGESNARAA